MTARELRFTPRPGGGLQHQQPPARPLRPRVLCQRVDALYLAFQGELRPEAKAELERLQAKAVALREEVAFDLSIGGGEVRGALSSRSRENWWTFRSAWLSVTVDQNASHEWRIEARPSALLLMREGPRVGLEMARSAARALLTEVRGERVRRLDLCADLTGFELPEINVRGFVNHPRVKLADISTVKQYWRAGKRTGFVAGSGDALARIYDKTEHLRLGLDETKADDERSDWKAGGWDGTEDVARVEFQLRGKLLDELEIRSPERALERLDTVWAYCSKKWLRLVELGTASRKERCDTDARWRGLDDVVFRVRDEPARRVRAPAVPHARRLISACLNYNAAAGLVPLIKGDARYYVAGWTNERAEAWLRDSLQEMASRTVRAAVADLIERSEDPREAAAKFLEKRSAAAAKYSSFVTRHETSAAAAA